jgi:hypothetical protein
VAVRDSHHRSGKVDSITDPLATRKADSIYMLQQDNNLRLLLENEYFFNPGYVGISRSGQCEGVACFVQSVFKAREPLNKAESKNESS